MSAATPDPGDTSWEQTLARLEADVDRIESAVAAGEAPEVGGWTPPSDLGPLPAHLRDRAVGILERQTRVLARTSEVARGLARQRTVTARMSSGRAASAASAYVDVRA